MKNKIGLQTIVVPKFLDEFLKENYLYNLKQLFELIYEGKGNTPKIRKYLIDNYKQYGFDDPYDFLATIKIFDYEVQPERISSGNNEIDEIIEFMTEEEYHKFYNFLNAGFQAKYEIERAEQTGTFYKQATADEE